MTRPAASPEKWPARSDDAGEDVRARQEGPARRESPAREESPARWVSDPQRERLLVAMVDEVAERGLRSTTIEAVASRAGLPPSAFIGHFADPEECLLAAYDALIQRALAHSSHAYRLAAEDWPNRVQVGLGSFVCFVARRPAASRACLVETLQLGPRALEHRFRAIELLEHEITVMVREAPPPLRADVCAPASIAGGLWRVVEQHLRHHRTDELEQRVEELGHWVLSHLHGAESLDWRSERSGAPDAAFGRELVTGAISQLLRVEPHGKDPQAFAGAVLTALLGADRATRVRAEL